MGPPLNREGGGTFFSQTTCAGDHTEGRLSFMDIFAEAESQGSPPAHP